MAHFFFDMTWLWKAKPDSLPQFQVSIHLQVVFLYTLQSSEMMGIYHAFPGSAGVEAYSQTGLLSNLHFPFSKIQ